MLEKPHGTLSQHQSIILKKRLLIVLASVCLQTSCLVWLLTALGTPASY